LEDLRIVVDEAPICDCVAVFVHHNYNCTTALESENDGRDLPQKYGARNVSFCNRRAEVIPPVWLRNIFFYLVQVTPGGVLFFEYRVLQNNFCRAVRTNLMEDENGVSGIQDPQTFIKMDLKEWKME
jgi:hypothetical protein